MVTERNQNSETRNQNQIRNSNDRDEACAVRWRLCKGRRAKMQATRSVLFSVGGDCHHHQGRHHQVHRHQNRRHHLDLVGAFVSVGFVVRG